MFLTIRHSGKAKSIGAIKRLVIVRSSGKSRERQINRVPGIFKVTKLFCLIPQ